MNDNCGILEEAALVSVIVPVHNVEDYVVKCITSIVSQTYANLEIIIIDDGSTDNSLRLVSELSDGCDRIKVFHQKNSGVSVARNLGINAAMGDYIMFVDGDDYLADDCVAYLMDMAIKTGAEFCLSKNCYTKIGETQVAEDKIQILSPDEGVALLLAPIIKVGCWNKIFKRSFIVDNKLSFSPELFYGEGLRFIITAALLANKVGVGTRKVYYYRRNNGTSATTVFNIEKIINGEKSIDSIEKDIINCNKSAKVMHNYHRTLYYLGAIVRLKDEKLDKKYIDYYKKWRKYVKANSTKFLFVRQLSFYRKVLVLFGWMFPGLVACMDRKRRKRNYDYSI